MVEEAVRVFEKANLNRAWYNRLLENRQAIAEQLIAHDAMPKGSQVLAISKDGDALSLDMNEAFLAGLRQSGSTGELMYMGSLVNTFLDNFNCTTVRVTVNGQSFSTGHSEYDKPLQAFTF